MMKRSHYCAQTAESAEGQSVTVVGWVQKRRNLGGLVFVDLRDRTGIVQVIADVAECGREIFDAAGQLHQEYCVGFSGVVRRRVGDQVNANRATGAVEIVAREMTVFSACDTLPFDPNNEQLSDNVRYKYRYLDLRRPAIQNNLHVRHKVTMAVRKYFDENGFWEIETPMLCRSTPEGARDYLVPSRLYPGSFYALPQSPQIYKQLLMVSGYDRYFQIARCFRDEDLRIDRQPEFTQIDVEMSFVEPDDIMAVTEGAFDAIFRDLGREGPGLNWPRMTFAQAMELYGSDKPDTRFGLQMATVNDVFADTALAMFGPALASGRLAALCVPGGGALTRKQIDSLTEVARTYHAGGLAWLVPSETPRGSIAKGISADETKALCERLGAGENDLIAIVADAKAAVASTALGQVRLAVAEMMGLIDHNAIAALWVTEFPLLEYDEEAGRYVAMHHPFTSPMLEDLPLMQTNPGAVRARAYDAVINGVEVGGGSCRIHELAMQERMFALLGFTKEQAQEQFGFLLEAFRYGAPPHGGVALGLDRLVWLLTNAGGIRDVIAFPKMQNANCLMADAPNVVDAKQLDEVHLQLVAQQSAQ